MQAAIYAADRFSSRSGSFTTAVCPILAQMIQDLETPTELKVKLAGLFRHAHHDISTVRAALVSLQSTLVSLQSTLSRTGIPTDTLPPVLGFVPALNLRLTKPEQSVWRSCATTQYDR